MFQVEAVSSEEDVRVRVKVIDDQLTILYSQDIDMNGREGTFYVPAVITNTKEITVQVSTSTAKHRYKNNGIFLAVGKQKSRTHDACPQSTVEKFQKEVFNETPLKIS